MIAWPISIRAVLIKPEPTCCNKPVQSWFVTVRHQLGSGPIPNPPPWGLPQAINDDRATCIMIWRPASNIGSKPRPYLNPSPPPGDPPPRHPSLCVSACLARRLHRSGGDGYGYGEDATGGWRRSAAHPAAPALGRCAVPGASDGDAAPDDGAATLWAPLRGLPPASHASSPAAAVEIDPPPSGRGRRCGGREADDLGRGSPLLDGRELPPQLLRPQWWGQGLNFPRQMLSFFLIDEKILLFLRYELGLPESFRLLYIYAWSIYGCLSL